MAAIFPALEDRHAAAAGAVAARYRARTGPVRAACHRDRQAAYSAFFGSPLANFLVERHVRTVIVSGAETDVCVLSTVLDAVNIGFRVVIVEDALCSSSDVGHDALMTMYRTRFNEQIDLVEAECLRDIWADA